MVYCQDLNLSPALSLERRGRSLGWRCGWAGLVGWLGEGGRSEPKLRDRPKTSCPLMSPLLSKERARERSQLLPEPIDFPLDRRQHRIQPIINLPIPKP
jgi:hypothetical protein